jgi:glycine oxidase
MSNSVEGGAVGRRPTSRAPRYSQSDVAVVGGGIIGLATAWRACQAGLSVTLLERARTGEGTSHVAAGMLAPVAEVEFGEAARHVLDLGLRSAAMWPEFAAELEDRSGLGVGLRQTGTLVVARDDDEARELERQLAFRESLGLRARRLLPSAARELEPALAPTIRLALHAPDDHSVDPRLVLAALRRACELAGVKVREQAQVAAVEHDGVRVTGVSLHDGLRAAGVGLRGAPGAAGFGRHGGVRITGDGARGGERIEAGQVVLAAGAWTSELGLPAEASIPVRPVKGQILRLHDPAGPGLLTRVVRYHGGYLVPRGDGRYVLGATMEERGHDLRPTAGGVYELLRDAHELVPGIEELQIEELSVGLRPSTPDNAPAIGPGVLDGLWWATGHHRNGILLAPLTAELIASALVGDLRASDLAGCHPQRLLHASDAAGRGQPGPPLGVL